LKAFTSPTIQTIVSARLAKSLLNADQPRPIAHSPAARAASTKIRISGPSIRRSSIVPTIAMSTVPPRIQATWESAPPSMSAAGTAAAITAAPPR